MVWNEYKKSATEISGALQLANYFSPIRLFKQIRGFTGGDVVKSFAGVSIRK